ncbi:MULTISPECIES: HAD family hydrolase [Sphingomonas]|uniref:phosphoglycolate phosphatase n=1 Tax=Sphingomonas trueperi TaxID=53317 RepID=A0A7X5XWE5_9SPHN|nr:HAD-IA family hydrolase [Sphingomonas sp. ABOLE]NJB96327.1 phosphoglycolate phosphatase [Sphingomonas trueperi]RSV42517.1 HAD family hydrolase [Sphingomonas sp. ABOLE]
MIRHVIFDLDGTLVDSCEVCVSILTGMIGDRGIMHVIDPVEARLHMSSGGAEMVSALLGPARRHFADDLADFRARYARHVTKRESLFPGVAAGIERLHRAGLRLSICSNKPQNLVDKVLEDTGLAPYFDVVVGGQPGLRPKPEPDLLRAVTDRLGCAPQEAVFVGDSELDHAVARDAGMGFYLMTYGYADPEWDPGESDCFDCFSTFTNALSERIGSVHA